MYNRSGNGEELALAGFFLRIVYLPYTISSWITELLPKPLTPALLGVLLASFIVLLLAASMIQWLFIIARSRFVSPMSKNA